MTRRAKKYSSKNKKPKNPEQKQPPIKPHMNGKATISGGKIKFSICVLISEWIQLSTIKFLLPIYLWFSPTQKQTALIFFPGKKSPKIVHVKCRFWQENRSKWVTAKLEKSTNLRKRWCISFDFRPQQAHVEPADRSLLDH